MKNLSAWMVLAYLSGIACSAEAQTTTPVPTAVNGTPSTRTEIKARIRGQVARINGDSKEGKLTAVQASSLSADLNAIRGKMKADYVINGKKRTDE